LIAQGSVDPIASCSRTCFRFVYPDTQMPLRLPSPDNDGGDDNPAPEHDPVELGELAERLGGYSGADIEGLCR
jgi:SpoVK/Ycf46/Vps4 family AAA+-type ATPase